MDWFSKDEHTEGLHVGRWDQLELMAQYGDLARLMVRRGARFHADQARTDIGEKLDSICQAGSPAAVLDWQAFRVSQAQTQPRWEA